MAFRIEFWKVEYKLKMSNFHALFKLRQILTKITIDFILIFLSINWIYLIVYILTGALHAFLFLYIDDVP